MAAVERMLEAHAASQKEMMASMASMMSAQLQDLRKEI
eukprot:COSAG05_NODE_17679_length_321_cov_0.693694_1_plen_37_part_10